MGERYCDCSKVKWVIKMQVLCMLWRVSTGPVCSLKPVSRAPVRGLKEFPQTGGLSIRERNELPSWLPGQSIIPAAQTRKAKVLLETSGEISSIGCFLLVSFFNTFYLLETIEQWIFLEWIPRKTNKIHSANSLQSGQSVSTERNSTGRLRLILEMNRWSTGIEHCDDVRGYSL